jgi:hypothetical protein
MPKKTVRKWIQKADIEEGALTAKAKAAGMSISAFCAQSDLTAKSVRQCNLAKTFRRMNQKKD